MGQPLGVKLAALVRETLRVPDGEPENVGTPTLAVAHREGPGLSVRPLLGVAEGAPLREVLREPEGEPVAEGEPVSVAVEVGVRGAPVVVTEALAGAVAMDSAEGAAADVAVGEKGELALSARSAGRTGATRPAICWVRRARSASAWRSPALATSSLLLRLPPSSKS